MQLTSIKLRNIRSYTEAAIGFPTGIVMLSGDIGAGKSTILLAIEFALFGILRGELSGSALLRNGTTEGSVELTFDINGTTYGIKRTLRRNRTSVEQDAGAFYVNGTKHDGTAIELKSKILELLGYPPELLTKTKNLVYRYTVYTPQEDMKRILLEDKETRLSILRKVFDIDKYQRIKHNATIYAKTLRERKRTYEGMLIDADEKKQLHQHQQQELSTAKQELARITPQLDTLRAQLLQARHALQTIEQERHDAEQHTRELHITRTQLQSTTQQHTQLLADLRQLTTQLQDAIAPPPNNADITQQLHTFTQHLIQKEQQIRELTTQQAKHSTLKQQAEELSASIASLDSCPTCLQDVTADHKTHITSTQQHKIQEHDQHIHAAKQQSQHYEQEKAALTEQIDALRRKEQDAAVLAVKYKQYQDMQERKNRLEEHASKLRTDSDTFAERITALEQTTVPLETIQKKYADARAEADALQEQEKTRSIQHATLAQKCEHLTQHIAQLADELAKKAAARKHLDTIHHTHHWLADAFVPLMDVIEQHVMLTIHREFDALFQQWFSLLIDDTIMTARLDETFTPIIQQNGYDVDIHHLSGGERTACALAYRLALNKTINSLITNMNTKDLLILDEPTDGFSTEQLDRMRDVLEQLELQQIIIVSHEQKLESFADEIIRITKQEHMSTILEA